MKVTFILKGVTDTFYEGRGDAIVGLLNMSDAEKFAYLNKARHDFGFSMKIGTGQFRDAVELNQILREAPAFTFTLEPRRGYKLATFQITKA
ncbi:hypothetical protein [Cupriavidus basilensis]|uniref:hypothetical protein n=1 Tax=Cupriavidus basilensis TaxID=68895 RepID=UPI0020A6638B|nr:hypothetical protein [Cupriavidus basilensis]MCP3024977.1 hypothetical protein [Cupriavidus basilensis]